MTEDGETTDAALVSPNGTTTPVVVPFPIPDVVLAGDRLYHLDTYDLLTLDVVRYTEVEVTHALPGSTRLRWVLEVEQPGNYDDHYQRPSFVLAIFDDREAAERHWDALPRVTRLVGGENVEGRDLLGTFLVARNVYQVPVNPTVGGSDEPPDAV